MEGLLEKQTAKAYFLGKSVENIAACYSYFSSESNFPNISKPTEDNPEFEEQLIFVFSCLSAKFDMDGKRSELFAKADQTMDKDAIAMNASSPLPSVKLSGMFNFVF